MEYSTFYIELDSLFDTRLSTLYTFGPDAVDRAIAAGYYERSIDIFPDIDTDLYQKRYASRDKSLLHNSVVTSIIDMLKDYVSSIVLQANSSPFKLKPKILLNTYPYTLGADEEKILISTLVHITQGIADIELISYNIEQLTPIYVKKNIAIMAMYEYYKWIEHHSATGDFNRVTCPEVTLLGPAIYYKGLPNHSDMEIAKKEKITPFQAMEIIASPLIGLKLMPVRVFSMAIELLPIPHQT